MRYIKDITPAELVTLKEAQKYSDKPYFRERTMAIELSYCGKTVPYIANLLHTRTDTIYTWMNRWESEGIMGLMIKSGRVLNPKRLF